MIFYNYYWFLFLIVLALFFPIVLWYGKKQYLKKLEVFIGIALQKTLVNKSNNKAFKIRLILLVTATVFLVLTLARPLLTEQEENVQRAGVDFMIAIDVSKSMMTRDIKPDKNRLEAVKRAVRDLLKKSSGDRVGLIAFAGEARMITPMTFNHSTLDLVLEHLSPETIWRSGSDLSKPIEVACKFLGKKELAARVLVIFSDGEQHETDPGFVAREAKLKSDLTVFTIGVGSREGAKIPIETKDESGNVTSIKYLKDINEEYVISKLNDMQLRNIARITNGGYAQLKSRAWDSKKPSALDVLYESQIKPLAQSLRVSKVVSHEEIFQIPLLIAILLLMLEMLVSDRRKKVADIAKEENE